MNKTSSRRSSKRKSTLAVMTKVRELAVYIFNILENSSKKYRLTMVNRLQNYSLDVIENIYLANKSFDKDKRKYYQDEANTKLAMCDYMANLMCELHVILVDQYGHISLLIGESLKLLKAWQNSDSTNSKLVSTSNEDS